MIKKLFFISLLFATNHVLAQQGFYLKLSDEKCDNIIYDVIPYNSNDFIVALSRRNCDNQTSYASGEILHVSNNGTIIKTIKKFNTAPNIIETISKLYQIPGGFFIITNITDNLTGGYALGFYHCDQNFDTVNQYVRVIEGENELLGSYYDEQNRKIIYAHYDSAFNSFTGSISLDCKNKKLSSNIGKDSTIICYNISNVIGENTNYIVTTFSDVYKVDSNLNFINWLPVTDDNNNAIVKIYGKNKYLKLAEESYGFPANFNKPATDDITCKILDENWNVLKNRTLGKGYNKKMKIDSFDVVGLKTLDFKDPNKIYVGWSSFRDYQFLVPFEEQDMWVGVAQLDSNLVPRWTRYFWGKGYNYLQGLIATTDNGVLLYGNQSAVDSLYPNGFLLKLNENGTTVSIKDEAIEDKIFITIGPNPFRTNVTFAIGQNKETMEEMQLYVYDILGQLVKKEKLDYGLNHFSFTDLPNATYIYNILSNNKLLKQGKLIKID
ncbi:MAG: T9SS type A sorting domain-containing protein [Bacteroidia bacterium]